MCDDSGVCRLFLKHFGTFPPELSFPLSFERGKGKCRARARFFHFPGYCMHALQPTCQAWRNLNAGQEQWNPQEERRIESTEKPQFGLPSQWPYQIRPKVLAQDLFFLHCPIFTERLSANSKWSMTFPFIWPFSSCKGEKFNPAFTSLWHGLNLALCMQTALWCSSLLSPAGLQLMLQCLVSGAARMGCFWALIMLQTSVFPLIRAWLNL